MRRFLLPAVVAGAAFAWVTPAAYGSTQENQCSQTTIQQVANALHRPDVVTLSFPEMMHGTCTSNGHLRNGKRIGVRIMFGVYSGKLAGIGTSVYTPLSNADPMTNSWPHEFAVGRARP